MLSIMPWHLSITGKMTWNYCRQWLTGWHIRSVKVMTLP